MKSTHLYLWCIATLLIFSSCKKKCTPVTKENIIHIPESEKTAIPYNGTELLTYFRQPENDTVVVLGHGISAYKEPANYSDEEKCINYKLQKDLFEYSYYNADNDFSISISQYFPYQDPSSYYSKIAFGIQSDEYFTFVERSDLVITNKSTETIVFGKRTYKNLTVFGENNNTQNVPQNRRCYYSKEDGLVRMVLPNGEIYTLIGRY